MQRFERFLYPIGILACISAGTDYYVRSYYWSWDPVKSATEENRPVKLYLVDYSKISKPAACTCTRPNPSWRTHSFFAPRNGAVIKARDVPEHEDWVQLAPGDFLEKVVCGVQVLIEVEESKLTRPITKNCQYYPELLQRAPLKSWSEEAENGKQQMNMTNDAKKSKRPMFVGGPTAGEE